jgi:DNA repair photolyase
MAPVVPGFTTDRRKLEATIRAIAEHDAAFIGANVLYLKGGTKDHFMGFLQREFPHLIEGYERLYPGAYASKPYSDAVRNLIGLLRERHGVGRRPSPGADDDEDEPELESESQETFEWDR